MKSFSRVWLLATPWTAACQAPLSMGFSRQEYWSGPPVPSPVWMWELDYKENWGLKNWCFWTLVLEKTLESPLDCKEIQPVHPKGDQSWVFIGRSDFWSWNSNTLAIWCEELTHLKRPWCWERLRAGGKGEDRGWDGWMASLTQWSWVWVNSRSSWQTGRCGAVHRVTEWDMTEGLNWTEPNN